MASSSSQPSQQTDNPPERKQSSTNVEMNELASQQHQASNSAAAEGTASAAAPAAAVTPSSSSSPPETAAAAQQPASAEGDDAEAIGPSDTNISSDAADPSGGPSLHITLLLTSGARHPYRIDQKYLRKRNVEVEDSDPYNISVYTLKELIWRDWRSEWEPRPTNPSYIRLISFGRMLEDKLALKECRFSNDSPNIVHMTVKPQEIVDEEETAKGAKGRGADGEERDAGCRCVVL